MSEKNLQPYIPVFSVLLAFAAGSAIIALTGTDPVEVYQKMVRSTFGSGYGFGQVLFRSTTLVLTGLAVALPFRVKLFNVGAEGQLLMGSFAAAICGTMIPVTTSPLIAAPAALLAAMAAGSIWAVAAGLLKVRFGVNEVISTIMLNFIAQALTGYLLTNHFAVPSTVHTSQMASGTTLPGFDRLFGLSWHSPANLSTLIAILISLLLALLLFRSRYGFTLSASGLNPEAARHAGIDTDSRIIGAMAIGGALAGLGAGNLVLGYKHWFESGLTSGAGFMGIAVALLAGAHPLWILLSALLFGWLDYGGLTVNTMVPKEIFMIVQAVTILAIISFPALSALRKR
ncbi:MAG: ABC transporter permease [Chlorobiaceae bacterium]|nr:ABC transporter permease [Chlorobiaceae bacterium]NTV26348.1 ABC transporter permease [Chlorobiaceae bacterium]